MTPIEDPRPLDAAHSREVPRTVNTGSGMWFDCAARRSQGILPTAAEIAGLLGLGGAVVAKHERLTVLADPEGNEFCLLRH
jgi:hypothetical protein